MDIPSYRKQHELSQADFAAFLTEAGIQATQSLISQYENGDVTIPAERAIAIEHATHGEIGRADLRSDLWTNEQHAA